MNYNGLPLVSVIVPCYNHANYITLTIESILNQTYSNIEIIVIDDKSSDNSVNVIKTLQDKYNFIFIIHSENRGLSTTLNEAIEISAGKYISAIASDDYWPEYKIAKQVEILEKHSEYAVCFGKQIGFTDTGAQKKFENPAAHSGYIFNDLIKWNFSIPALTAMIRRRCIDEVGGYDPAIAIEDWYMWLKLAEKYPFYFIDDFLGYYRLHQNNMSKKILWMIEEKQKILDLWKDEPIYNDALQKHRLMSFWKLSGYNKELALLMLIKCNFITSIQSRYFYRGIVKLLLPCRDYALN